MSGSTKILYVDDEPDIREIAVLSLQLRPDFEVRSVSSGAAALEVAEEWQPDIVLLDVMMPDMDGPMTRERLKANGKTEAIPVAFVTARTQPQEVERFQAMNVVGIIAKPFDPMTLCDKVSELLPR
jgi:CheY-like chemotaxis protein